MRRTNMFLGSLGVEVQKALALCAKVRAAVNQE